MRVDGKIERHDELLRDAWYKTTDPGRRQASADLSRFYGYISEAMQLHQGYYIPHPLDGFSGNFPNVWYIKDGMKVYNTTVGVMYTIQEHEEDSEGMPTGNVLMTGGNGIAPKQGDRLEFDRGDTLIFMHAFPKTFAQTYEFMDDGSGRLSAQYTAEWRDTITWSVARREPGGLDGAPFEGTRDVRPHHRSSGSWGPDQAYLISYTGQWFDVLIQFDCWAKTNSTSERLVEWFEGFMETYRGVFRYNGVNNLLYWDRTHDELVTRWRDDIVNRTLRYYVRMENVAAVLESKIRSITALFSLLPTGTYVRGTPFWVSGWIPPTGAVGSVPAEIYETD